MGIKILRKGKLKKKAEVERTSRYESGSVEISNEIWFELGSLKQ